MPRNVRIGLIQARTTHPGDTDPQVIKEAMIAKHLAFIEDEVLGDHGFLDHEGIGVAWMGGAGLDETDADVAGHMRGNG